MKYLLSDLLTYMITFLFFMLPAQPNNVEITVIETTTESRTITYEVDNNTRRTITNPVITSVEKKVNGQWEKEPMLFGSMIMPDIAYIIYPPYQDFKDSVTISEGFQLEKGEYKLTFTYRVAKSFNTTQGGTTSCIFSVTE